MWGVTFEADADGSEPAGPFVRFTTWLHRCLPVTGPFGFLGRAAEPTLIGFLLLSASGFAVDLFFLWLFKGVLGVPFPVAVSLGYGLASLYNFAVNRVLNFRAHGHLAGQTAKWLVAAALNYLLWILGLSWLLEHVGVQYLVARLSVTAIEVAWLYTLTRFWVFRGTPQPDAEA